MEFIINTPAGCPGGGVWYNPTNLLFLIILGFVAYFGIGTFINIRTKQLEGKEAIPNIELLREFPNLVKEGVVYSTEKVKLGI